MDRRTFTAVLIPTLLSGCSLFHNLAPDQRRAVIVSLDGGGQDIIDHLIADGAMPNLARLRSEGVTAEYSRTNFPSKTAAGHAALWTGGYGDTNGITSNKVFKVPLREHTILETADGFDSAELLSEPIWVTAARAGRRSIVLQATHVAPLATYEPGGRFGGPYSGSMTLLDGYAGVVAKEAVYSQPPLAWSLTPNWGDFPKASRPPRYLDLSADGVSFRGVVYDDPNDPTLGYDTVALANLNDPKPFAVLKPGTGAQAWSGSVELMTEKGKGACTFRLFSLPADGHEMVLYRTPVVHELANKPEAAQTYYGDWPFVPQGALESWSKGAFGKTMYQGGDGTAEARYLDTVDHLLDCATQRAQVLMKRRDWDLAISYLPYPDEALHAWFGTVDPQSPSYDPVIAPKVWKLIDHIGGSCDRYIGALRADDTVVAVASDHGMAGLKWKFFPNAVLRKAGLLTLTPDGKVDLAHTQAMYTATDGAFIEVNSTEHKDGIVALSDVPAVLDKVEAALRAVRADDGKPLVTEFARPGRDDALPPLPPNHTAGRYDGLGLGGIRGGDLYLDLHPGFYFSPDYSKTVFTAPFEAGQGGHVFDPRRADMHAALSLAGPGIKRGVKIGPVRNIDLAPTITFLLGMPKPLRATGRVLEEALAE